MLTVLTSGKGAPGVTTVALGLALAWPAPVLLVEADPAGGTIRHGYGQGADLSGRSMLGWHVAARRIGAREATWANAVRLEGECWLVPGVDTPAQAASIDYAALAATLTGLGVDILVDAGRIPGPVGIGPLVAAADKTVVVLRSTLASVHAAQSAANHIADLAGSTSVGAIGVEADSLVSVVVGAGRPYPLGDVRAAMTHAAPLAGEVAWDPMTAAVLSDGGPAPRRFDATAFMRSASRLASALAPRGGEQDSPVKTTAPQPGSRRGERAEDDDHRLRRRATPPQEPATMGGAR